MTFDSSTGSNTLLAQHALSRTGWLSEQSEGFQRRMMAIARWRTVPAGVNLYEVGDDANAVFGLEKGLLDISIPISADEMVTIHRAHEGFWIGDSALLADTTRGISVTTRVESLVLTIPTDSLLRHLAECPEDMICFFKLNHANTMLALRHLAEVIALPPRARFARMLLRFASEDGRVPVTQGELGAMAGMSRAAFRRAFAGLIENRIVRTEYGHIRILDLAALEKEANTP